MCESRRTLQLRSPADSGLSIGKLPPLQGSRPRTMRRILFISHTNFALSVPSRVYPPIEQFVSFLPTSVSSYEVKYGPHNFRAVLSYGTRAFLDLKMLNW